jgi:hypothetical protein
VQPLQHRIGCSVGHIRPSVLASPLQRAIAMYLTTLKQFQVPDPNPRSNARLEMFGWLLLLLLICYLLKWLCWPATPPPSPPSITFTCVRILANGSPPHLVRFKTINEPQMTNTFLHRIPDMRSFWRPESPGNCKMRRDLTSNWPAA